MNSNFRVWLLDENIEEYTAYAQQCDFLLPYQKTEYLLAEEKAENFPINVFLYEERGGFALYTAIVRRVNELPYMREMEGDFYDMITPHEYAGIITNTFDRNLIERLLTELLSYCRDNCIIFTFTRINPYFCKQPQLFERAGFQVYHSCAQVMVDLTGTEEDIFSRYKSSTRRNIHRALKESLSWEIAETRDKSVELFAQMYWKAMDILGAKRFLYFNMDYFKALLTCECARLFFVKDIDGKVIAAAIILLGEETVYYHLGCFDRDFTLKRPMNYLMHAIILWSKRAGYKVFHLGGGGESLLRFKEGYSPERIDYYIAVGIPNINEYEDVCSFWKERFPDLQDRQYYPLYRYNEE